jgi:hypothetical protein
MKKIAMLLATGCLALAAAGPALAGKGDTGKSGVTGVPGSPSGPATPTHPTKDTHSGK